MLKLCLLTLLTLLPTSSYAESTQLDYKISLEYPEYVDNTNILNQTSWNYIHPGSAKIKYVGLHKVFLNQLERQLKKEARRQTRIYYNNSNMTDEQAFSRLELLDMPFEETNWYDRSWWHNLPTDKGGAPPREDLKIGWEITIPRNFALIHWAKEQVEEIKDIWITHDHIEDNIEDGSWIINNTKIDGKKQDDKIKDLHKYTGESVDLHIKVKQYKWFVGKYHHLRFRPSLRLKSNVSSAQLLDELSIKFLIELYRPVRNIRHHFANLLFFLKRDFTDNETVFSISLDLIKW